MLTKTDTFASPCSISLPVVCHSTEIGDVHHIYYFVPSCSYRSTGRSSQPEAFLGHSPSMTANNRIPAQQYILGVVFFAHGQRRKASHIALNTWETELFTLFTQSEQGEHWGSGRTVCNRKVKYLATKYVTTLPDYVIGTGDPRRGNIK